MKSYPFRLLKKMEYQQDGVEVVNITGVNSPEFQQSVLDTYLCFTPARNATSTICRGLRWGTLANGRVYWSDENVYQLDAKLNPIEGGKARVMDLIPTSFLKSAPVKEMLDVTFKTFHPNANSHKQHYVVQVSALCYETDLKKACYPTPDMPHQDGFNNAIFVLYKSKGLLGGQSRIYAMDGTPLFETELSVGNGIFVRDSQYLHAVVPMTTCSDNSDSEHVMRCILIIRIDPSKR